jgi:CSLREA domain-containing protein
MKRRTTALSLAAVLLGSFSAGAATFVVTTTTDANHGACTVSLCSLRDAVIAANANAGADTITLPAGTYMLTLTGVNEDAAATGDLDVTGDLTINGAGSATTTINGNGTDRVFQVIGAVTLTLNGVTITGGNTTASSTQDGGGILTGFSAGTLILNNCVVTGNNGAGGQGGGIFANNVTLTNSTVSGNSTSSQGAGIFATSATISGSTITNNNSTGDQGGGLFLINGSSTITNSTISSNSAGAGADGGGIYLNGSINANAPALLTITNSTFSNNSAPDGGGIFILSFATVTITGSTFTVNAAQTGGGAGIFNLGGLLSLTNCTFNQNGISGGTQGGTGILNSGGNTTITNCTVDSNSMLSGPGAAIANSSGTVTLKNTIIEANNGGNCSGTIVDGGGNQQNPGTTCGATIPTRAALLQALDNNGGPTQTQALGSGSSAINAAVGCPPPATDQRGISRPQGSACDIGSFECQTGECGLGAVTNTPTSTPTNTPVGVATSTPTNTPTLTPTSTRTPTTVAATATQTPTVIAGVVVPTLTFPMLGLLGLVLAVAGTAILLWKRG